MSGPVPLTAGTVLALLALSPDDARVVALSSDRDCGLATVVDRVTGRLIRSEEFRWREGSGWTVGPLDIGATLVAASGLSPERAGRETVARVGEVELPVIVSPEGWWTVVAFVGDDVVLGPFDLVDPAT